MRKITALIMALLMIVSCLSLAACGDYDKKSAIISGKTSSTTKKLTNKDKTSVKNTEDAVEEEIDEDVSEVEIEESTPLEMWYDLNYEYIAEGVSAFDNDYQTTEFIVDGNVFYFIYNIKETEFGEEYYTILANGIVEKQEIIDSWTESEAAHSKKALSEYFEGYGAEPMPTPEYIFYTYYKPNDEVIGYFYE